MAVIGEIGKEYRLCAHFSCEFFTLYFGVLSNTPLFEENPQIIAQVQLTEIPIPSMVKKGNVASRLNKLGLNSVLASEYINTGPNIPAIVHPNKVKNFGAKSEIGKVRPMVKIIAA